MTLHTEALEAKPACIIVPTTPKRRLVLKQWDGVGNPNNIQVIFQHMRPNGAWESAVNGLLLSPENARLLAPALLEIAAAIDGSPVDPMPTEEDREASRMP